MFVRFTLVWPLEFFKTNDAFDLNNETVMQVFEITALGMIF